MDTEVSLMRVLKAMGVLATLWAIFFCSGCGGEDSTATAVLGTAEQPAAIEPDASLAAELEMLRDMPTPQAVDEAVFATLKIELAHMLSALGEERFVSSPPMTAGSQAQLSWNADTSNLFWGYCCSGDYNQDSLVGVNDITPLGQNYLAEVPADPNSLLAVVDGNGNGLIEVADITPIGQNFQARVTAYNVYASESLTDYPIDATSGNGDATLLGSVPFPEGPPPAGQRRQFSFAVTDPQPETYFWVRPTDSASEGTPSSYYYLATPANDPPVASLTADPVFGDIPMPVEFDASASYDPDGEIVKFEWDWDGGNDGWVWEDTGTTSVVEHTFETIDTYPATVRVTDNEGDTRTASVEIRATAPGNDPPVAVLTADVTEGEIPLTVNFSAIQSSDPDGEIVDYEWDLDGDDEYGEPGNEAIASGHPFSSYTYEMTGNFAATVRTTDNEGAKDEGSQSINATRVPTGEWIYIVVDSTEISGDTAFCAPSLAVIDGNPAISYGARFGEVNKLKYVYSPSFTGVDALAWNEPVTVDPAGGGGWYTSLAEVAGSPAIGYLGGGAKYIRANTSAGSEGDWGQPVMLDSNPNWFGYPFIAVVSGNPATAFVTEDPDPDPNDGNTVVYRRANTGTGSSLADWGPPVTVMPDIAVGSVRLVVVAGNPAITCEMRDPVSEDSYRCYVRSTTAVGTSSSDWPEPVTIMAIPLLHDTHWMAIINGNPAIVFSCGDYDQELVFTRSASATGETAGDWSQPVSITTKGDGWPVLASVAGRPALAYSHSATYGGQKGVWFVHSTSGDGTQPFDWGTPKRMEDHSAMLSMAEVNGNPAIVYPSPGRGLIYAYYDN